MVPDISRRRYVAALSAVGAAAVAGCTGSPAGDGNSTSTDATTTTTESTTESDTTTEAETTADDATEPPTTGPTAPVEAFIGAEDVETFQAQFHPLHPFNPENLDEEDAESLLENAVDPESLDTERVDQSVSPELVQVATLPGDQIDEDAVADALDGTDAAVVVATVTDSDGSTEETRFVTVSFDGEWVILAHGVPTQAELDARELDAHVVDDVTFDSEEDTARVHVLDEPVADSVTVEATSSGSSSSSDDPGTVTHLDVELDSDGDEVVVTATVGGESRVVHRERYPKSARIVDEVEFDDDPDSARDAAARVVFTDVAEDGRVSVESTVWQGEVSAEPAGNTDYLVVGIDPDGDQIVVTLTLDGETEELHRERFYP